MPAIFQPVLQKKTQQGTPSQSNIDLSGHRLL